MTQCENETFLKYRGIRNKQHDTVLLYESMDLAFTDKVITKRFQGT